MLANHLPQLCLLTADDEAWPNLRWHWRRWHVSNLLDEKFPFINKLLVVGAILKEMLKKNQQLFSIH